MVDVIADFENARNALGYDRINLMSASYGTRVALLYAYLHPATV
jgi:pimeloyl-ACP methyl ester carboxylesterase